MFDRIILLSEGYTIFNGNPKDVQDHFTRFGLQMGQFENPADKLSKIASDPQSCMNTNVTILQLADH